MTEKKPQLSLIGAGPGDPSLITVKAIEALKRADVVLYDALVNKELLKYARPEAKKVFVGKRAGLHHIQQFFINRLIVKYALQFGTVARLKGGDPYIFGRGHEEYEYAMKQGLTVEIIPGVSSATAIPALQNIPLTRRGICQSFCVVTATGKSGGLSKDLQWAATGRSTLVILMGMKKLAQIIDLLRKYRPVDEPVVIIQDGTTENEKAVFGTLSTILEKSKEAHCRPPAIIICGQVIKQKLNEIRAMTNHQIKN